MVLMFPVIFAITPVDGSCYRVIDLSILQDFFSSVLKFLPCCEKETVRKKIKKNEYCSMIMLFENVALSYSLLYNFHMWFCVPI